MYVRIAIMTVTIELKPEIEKALQQKAKENGFEVNIYLEQLIEKDIERRKLLDEVLAPIRKNFAESGMSEDDLDALVESERQVMWKEKNGTRAS